MSMETSGDQDTGLRRTGPTVTRDRWTLHARRKLSKGYVLIVGTTRKNANFHSPEKGYEMCAYDVARKLIEEGVVVKTRKHHLGDVYELSDVVPEPAAATSVVDDDDDDLALGGDIEPAFDADVEEDVDEDEDDLATAAGSEEDFVEEEDDDFDL